MSEISQRDQDSATRLLIAHIFSFCLIILGEMFANRLYCKTHKVQLGICLLSRLNVQYHYRLLYYYTIILHHTENMRSVSLLEGW